MAKKTKSTKIKPEIVYIASDILGGSISFEQLFYASTDYEKLIKKIVDEIEESGIYDGIIDFTDNTVRVYDPDNDDRESYDDEDSEDGWLFDEFDPEDISEELLDTYSLIAIHAIDLI